MQQDTITNTNQTAKRLAWQLGTLLIAVATTIGTVKSEDRMAAVVQRTNAHETMARETEVTRMPISFGVTMRTQPTSGSQ